MESLLPDAKIKYQEGAPFPHFVFDDFFDDNVVEKVLSEFPGKSDIDWIDYYDRNQIKLGNEIEDNIGFFTRYILYSLNSATCKLNAAMEDLSSYLMRSCLSSFQASIIFEINFFVPLGPKIFHGLVRYECQLEIIN